MSNLLRDLGILAKSSWTVNSNPGVNAQATATKAAAPAGSGIRRVCTGICASLAAGAVAPAAVELSVNLRDGASGAGNILWTGVISLPATAGTSAPPIELSGLQIVGSKETAMTLEFSGAGGANTFEAVSLQGFDFSDG